MLIHIVNHLSIGNLHSLFTVLIRELINCTPSQNLGFIRNNAVYIHARDEAYPGDTPRKCYATKITSTLTINDYHTSRNRPSTV